MEMKHTRGPWKVDVELSSRSGEYLISLDAGDRGRGIAIARTVPASSKELANACLIAAAPDLLAALELAAEVYEGAPALGNHSAMNKIRSAIKKAKEG